MKGIMLKDFPVGIDFQGNKITMSDVQDSPREIWGKIKTLSQQGLAAYLTIYFTDRSIKCPALPLPGNVVKIGVVAQNPPMEARPCH
jgi:predicted RNA-binding protein